MRKENKKKTPDHPLGKKKSASRVGLKLVSQRGMKKKGKGDEKSRMPHGMKKVESLPRKKREGMRNSMIDEVEKKKWAIREILTPAKKGGNAFPAKSSLPSYSQLKKTPAEDREREGKCVASHPERRRLETIPTEKKVLGDSTPKGNPGPPSFLLCNQSLERKERMHLAERGEESSRLRSGRPLFWRKRSRGHWKKKDFFVGGKGEGDSPRGKKRRTLMSEETRTRKGKKSNQKEGRIRTNREHT